MFGFTPYAALLSTQEVPRLGGILVRCSLSLAIGDGWIHPWCNRAEALYQHGSLPICCHCHFDNSAYGRLYHGAWCQTHHVRVFSETITRLWTPYELPPCDGRRMHSITVKEHWASRFTTAETFATVELPCASMSS